MSRPRTPGYVVASSTSYGWRGGWDFWGSRDAASLVSRPARLCGRGGAVRLPDDNGGVMLGGAGYPRGQAAGGEGLGSSRCLAVAGLDQQVTAWRKPLQGACGHPAQHVEAVGSAVERQQRLVRPGLGRQVPDLVGGHVWHVGGQDAHPA